MTKQEQVWEKQLAAVIAGAKAAPKKIGVFVDNGAKTHYFVKRLTEALPEFTIGVFGSPTKGDLLTKTLIITRIQVIDTSKN